MIAVAMPHEPDEDRGADGLAVGDGDAEREPHDRQHERRDDHRADDSGDRVGVQAEGRDRRGEDEQRPEANEPCPEVRLLEHEHFADAGDLRVADRPAVQHLAELAHDASSLSADGSIAKWRAAWSWGSPRGSATRATRRGQWAFGICCVERELAEARARLNGRPQT